MPPPVTDTANSRAKLIEATIELMSARGFEPMGIQSILESAGVSKSNFYYHFKSKEELCLAALDAMSEHFFNEFVDPVLTNKSLSPKKRLEKYLKNMSDMMESGACVKGCPFTNLATETSDYVPAFREKISQFFERYQQKLSSCFKEGAELGEFRSDISPHLASQIMLACMNGTMVLTKVHKKPQVMKENIRALMSVLAAK